VQGFRNLIRQEQERERRDAEGIGYVAAISRPAKIIRDALVHQTSKPLGADFARYDPQRSAFYSPIRDAWSAIAYEHFGYVARGGEYKELSSRDVAAGDLSWRYQRALAMGNSHPELITLDPQQVKILDALAEAADVPHQRGQAEIAIPEDLRDSHIYRWRFSPDGKRI
jgi:hypothetical protein